MRSWHLSAFVRDGISLVGIAIATSMAAMFLVLVLLDVAGYLTNPYLGLLLFVAVPGAFVLGLLLIPIGMWRAARRHRRLERSSPGAPLPGWPVIDLGLARQRMIGLVVLVLTVTNLVIVSVAAYGGVHYMESAEFCGQVCHTTMEPEYVAYRNSPHSRVACSECHVGPGVGALVGSKLAGTRQLWDVVTRQVPRPVPPPTHAMRPARDTCEHCHWPEKFHGDRVRVVHEYAEDEKNTETRTTLVMHVGGGSEKLGVGTGIHWHMNLDNAIEYVTTDPTGDVIPYVRLRGRDGRVREFVADGATPQQIAAGQRHVMDCMDCHNRPAHTFSSTPERAVNEAMAEGRIPRELPFVRREAAAAVRAKYPNRDAGLAGISRHLTEFYRAHQADARLVDRAVAGTQDVWARNVFPVMNVTWGTYPNKIGHLDAPGCFRCHDDNHKSKDGGVIRQDCETCHGMPSE